MSASAGAGAGAWRGVDLWYRPGGKKTCIHKDGRKKIHTAWPDGSEMVEEYSLSTDELLERRSRRPTTLGGEGQWVVEIGEPAPARAGPAVDLGLRESSSQPVFFRKDTTDAFVWRIRNLHWPADTYQLSVEGDEIVLRTTNKKYYKRWFVSDLRELGIPLEPARLSCSFASATLVITYRKPLPVMQAQERARAERLTMRPTSEDECKNS